MKTPLRKINYASKKILKTFPNIPSLLSYYQTPIGQSVRQSPTERRISLVLKKSKVKFVTECSFKGFGYENYSYRFDFYLPDYNVIIEYDGKHHLKEKIKLNDNIKNKFCKDNGIKIYRFNIKHYVDLEKYIVRLLKKLT